MLPEMVRQDHEVSLLTGSAEGVKDRYRYGGVEIYRTPLMDLNWLYKRGLKGLEEELAGLFSSFLDETKPDVVHVHNMHYFSDVHPKVLERFVKEKGIPLILTAHNVWDDLLFLDLTHRIGWDHIIAVSHFIKKELIGVGVEDIKITVIHHGVDEEEFNPRVNTEKVLHKYPCLKGRRVIFHPARISLAKGCDISIKAISIVKERYPNILLVLAGSRNIIDWGAYQQKDIAYLVALIKHLKLEDHVFIDSYTIDEMKELYAVSEVCIYPSSFDEPFGLTMLEAMATARPMIVTASGGMPEIIRDGINGFVIPRRDYEALAEKIDILLDNERLRRRLGYTGRQLVESSYTKGRVTEETLSLYRKVLSGKD